MSNLGQKDIGPMLDTLKEVAPSGFALAFHISFTTPKFLLQTYPLEWIKSYSERGLVMSDPTVHWGFANEGQCRWSELAHLDTNGILKEAAGHGLAYGVTCALEVENSRSIGSFARPEREFNESELSELNTAMEQLHALTAKLSSFSVATTNALHNQDVQFSQGPS